MVGPACRARGKLPELPLRLGLAWRGLFRSSSARSACSSWPFSTEFVVLRDFAKVIAASRATTTVKAFIVADFMTIAGAQPTSIV